MFFFNISFIFAAMNRKFNLFCNVSFNFLVYHPPGSPGVGPNYRVKARASGTNFRWNPGGVGAGQRERPRGRAWLFEKWMPVFGRWMTKWRYKATFPGGFSDKSYHYCYTVKSGNFGWSRNFGHELLFYFRWKYRKNNSNLKKYICCGDDKLISSVQFSQTCFREICQLLRIKKCRFVWILLKSFMWPSHKNLFWLVKLKHLLNLS